MNKKPLTFILIVVMLIQLFFPVAGIVYKNVIEPKAIENAPTYKMKLTRIDCVCKYDCMVYLNYADDSSTQFGKNRYATLTVDSDGFAQYELSLTKPKTGDYAKTLGYAYLCFPDVNITLPQYEKLTEVVFTENEIMFSIDPDGYITAGADEMYLEAKIYRGRVIPLNVYVDEVNILDALSYYEENFDFVVDVYLTSNA